VSLLICLLTHSRQRVEKELRRKDEELTDFVENVSIGLHLVGPDGVILWANRAELDMLGYSREEYIGRNIRELHVDPESIEDILKQLGGGGAISEYEARLRCKDGSIRHVLITSNVRWQDGRFINTRCLTRDITEQKQAEEALRASEERLRLALEAAYMGTWDYNVQTGEVRWSPNLEAIHGLAPGTFGGTFDDYMSDVHPEDRDRVMRTLAHSLEEGSEHNIEYRIVWPDGSIHWVEGRGRVIRDESGRPVRMTGVCMEITDRKQTQERERAAYRDAQEARQRLAFLAEASAALAASLDYETRLSSLAQLAVPALADFCIIDVIKQGGQFSRVAAVHRDFDKQELVERLRSFPPDPNIDAGVTRAMRTGKPEIAPAISDLDLQMSHLDPEHLEIVRKLAPTSYMIVPLLARGRTIGTISLAITQSRRPYEAADLTLAEELAYRAALAVDNARLYREAQESSTAKDEFLATISHELRTPLNAILGWMRLLKNDRLDQASRERALETIERNTKLQAQLVEDLLDVSSIITGKLHLDVRPTDLATVIKAAIDSVRPAIDAKAIEIVTSLDAKAGPVSGDPARLQQVVWNLLSNAIKFTPTGGRVEIKLERADSNIELSVSDTGEGIKPEFLPQVFDRFRQGDSALTRKHGGLGLGLSIVRHLVEMHSGTASARSDGVGHGATFVLRLPVPAVYPDLDRSDSNNFDSAEMLYGLRVLVVDDEADARDLLVISIEQHGAEAKAAASSREALDLFEQWRPDVVVSDIAMPGEDGYDLMTKIRSLPPSQGGLVPAIALTAYTREEDRIRSLSAGFQMHLPKPVDPIELAGVIASLAGRMRDRIQNPESRIQKSG
ncbi:MAG TPA: PAS domain-containing protein, partial [Blastocatellia bacterium]|nr:PAS domain-containing protein [Blastocatellia bacterium]